MRNIFIHIHIPKCGGTTVRDFLKRNFKSDLGTTTGILNDYQYNSKQVQRILELHPNLRCLTGHKLSMDLPKSSKLMNINTFSIIRDPVDRFLSHYFFHRNHTTFVPEAKDMDLDEYTDWALKKENQLMYINGQTRFLNGGKLNEIERAVSNSELQLFPLDKLDDALFTLTCDYPETFTEKSFITKNISIKDKVIPQDYRDLVEPYVQDDLRLCEIALNTPLKSIPESNKLSDINNNLSKKDWPACYLKLKWSSLKKLDKVYLFGAGKHTKWLLHIIDKLTGPKILAIIDEIPQSNVIDGIQVIQPNKVSFDETNVIIPSTDCNFHQFKNKIKSFYSNELQIINLYENAPIGPYPK